MLRFSEEERRRITKGKRGQGLLIVAANHVAIEVKLPKTSMS